MKIVVGLGNPGVEYENNRHNVGFMVVDSLAGEAKWESKFDSLIVKSNDVILVKPLTFMNQSGKAVHEIMNFYKVARGDLIVIHDDLDIRLGEYKIQMGIGPKVHNGVTSVEAQLSTKDFWRVRIGVDNRPVGEARAPGDEYVLADFTKDERVVVDELIVKITSQLLPK